MRTITRLAKIQGLGSAFHPWWQQLQSHKAKSVDTGNPLIESISARFMYIKNVKMACFESRFHQRPKRPRVKWDVQISDISKESAGLSEAPGENSFVTLGPKPSYRVANGWCWKLGSGFFLEDVVQCEMSLIPLGKGKTVTPNHRLVRGTSRRWSFLHVPQYLTQT